MILASLIVARDEMRSEHLRIFQAQLWHLLFPFVFKSEGCLDKTPLRVSPEILQSVG